MNKKVIGIFALLMLVLSSMPIITNVKPVFAVAPYGKSIVIDDSINRVNATLGAKLGSKITAKGVITNIGATTLTDLLTAVYFIEGTPGCVPTDFSFEFSLDCVTWFAIDPSEVKPAPPAASPWTVELVIGPMGGQTLNPGQSITLYLKMTFNNDLTPYSNVNQYIRSMAVVVFKDLDADRTWDGPPTEMLYSQPPWAAGVIDWDNPVKIDLAIVHTAEIDGTGKFYYTIQGAINAANPGNVIWVYPGTYAESISINKALTITGDPGSLAAGPGTNAPVLDGSTFTNIQAVTITQGTSDVVFEGFEIKNYGTIGNTDADGISVWNTGTFNVRINDNYIHNVGYAGILTGNGWGDPQGLHSGWTIARNKIEDFGAYAIDLENTKDTQIIDNVIQKPKGPYYGINVISLACDTNTIDVSNVNVTGNQIINYTGCAINLFAWTSDAGASATLRKIVVSGNTISGNTTSLLAWATGPGTEVLRDLTINGNSFKVDNPPGPNYMVNLADAGGSNTFTNNLLNLTGAIGGGGTFFHGVNIGGPQTGTWNIANNMLDGNNVGTSSVGFRLRATLPNTAILTFTGNTVTEFARGFQADALQVGTKVTVHYNNIAGNSGYGILNGVGEIIDARYNWWGSSSGPNHPTSWLYLGNPYGPNPGTGDMVSDYVLYKPWVLAPVVLPLVHDVAVLPPIPATFKIEAGSTVQIEVTATNKGTAYENFTVTIYYDSTAIATQSITDLAPGVSILLTFNWDTTGVLPHKYYTLQSVASVVPGETSTFDNTAVNPTPVLVGYFPTPTLKVEPAVVPNKILFMGETFDVNITLNGLSEDWHCVGAQFILSFNSSLVEVASVTEGPFFGSFTVPPQTTFFAYAVENPYGLVMVFLGPNENATYSQWPNGNGTIATVTFRVLQDVARGAVESSDLMLTNSPYFNTMLIDNEMNEVPHNSVSGTIRILGTIREDINQDGKVDIVDLAMVSAAFGSYPGHPRWNPDCDINQDGRVDIIDVAMVSGKYGWFRDDC